MMITSIVDAPMTLKSEEYLVTFATSSGEIKKRLRVPLRGACPPGHMRKQRSYVLAKMIREAVPDSDMPLIRRLLSDAAKMRPDLFHVV